ncbi:MAG: hypothetical protein EON87_10040 [Brevundimonas sp.]|nr:MAG: hypothetical protein EON87_10040 [Brevundimonas sp.]
MILAAAAVLALSVAPDPGPSPQAGQDPPATRQVAPTELDEVVVRGRLEEQVQAFVGEIAADAAPRGQFLAAWRDRVCPAVVNLEVTLAQAVLDRISTVAAELDVPTGDPGCDPNVVIVFTRDGAALASAMVEREPNVFRHPNVNSLNRPAGDLAYFTGAEAPVRWWHLSMPVSTGSGRRVVRLPGEGSLIIGGDGRLNVDVADVLYKVIIVVDVDQMNGVQLPQLADYLAMVSLAQIDPRAEVGDFPTVLNVFRRPTVAGLTDWDQSYLRGLYESASRRRNPESRNDDVARVMLRDQRQAAETVGE